MMLLLTILMCGSSYAYGSFQMNFLKHRDITILEERENFNIGRVEYDIQKPKIKGLRNKEVEENLNKLISKDIYEIEKELKKESYEDHNFAKEKKLDLKNYKCDIKYDVTTGNGILSIILNIKKFTGGSYEVEELKSYNLDIKNNKLVTLDEILTEKEYKRMKNYLRKKIRDSKEQYYVEKINSKDNFNFYCNDEKIVVYFGMNEIGPYTVGVPKIEIPLDEI